MSDRSLRDRVTLRFARLLGRLRLIGRKGEGKREQEQEGEDDA